MDAFCKLLLSQTNKSLRFIPFSTYTNAMTGTLPDNVHHWTFSTGFITQAYDGVYVMWYGPQGNEKINAIAYGLMTPSQDTVIWTVKALT